MNNRSFEVFEIIEYCNSEYKCCSYNSEMINLLPEYDEIRYETIDNSEILDNHQLRW